METGCSSNAPISNMLPSVLQSIECIFRQPLEGFVGILTKSDFVTRVHLPLVKLCAGIFLKPESVHDVKQIIDPLSVIPGGSSVSLDERTPNLMENIVVHLVTTEVATRRIECGTFPDINGLDCTWINSLKLHEKLLLTLLEGLDTGGTGYGEMAAEALDFVYRKISILPSLSTELQQVSKLQIRADTIIRSAEEWMEQSDDHRRRFEKFQVCMQSLNVLRCIVSTISSCPLAVSSRLFSKYDIPYLLCCLIDMRVWIRTHPVSGVPEKFRRGSWEGYTGEVCEAEGSCWISLLMLLSSDEIRTGAYSLTNSRVESILKIRKYLTQELIDQIPQLADMKRVLEELNVSNTVGGSCLLFRSKSSSTSHALSPFAIVDVGEESLFDKISRIEITPPTISCEESRIIAQAFAETYEGLVDKMEETKTIVASRARCEVCSSEASHRCSQCKDVVYCGEFCQLQHWDSHKAVCTSRMSIRL